MLVDSHQHFWQVGHFDYPWMSPEVEVLCRDYLPETLKPIIKECGVQKTVLVQASNSLAETYWLLSLAERHQFIAGVVGWVDLTDPAMEPELEVLTANAEFKGVRHLVESEPADDWLIQPNVLNGLRILEKHHVAFDLLVHTLVTFGGPPIPIAPAMNDAAIRSAIGDLPSTPLERGVSETIERFTALREGGRLDTGDIEAELRQQV